MSFFDTHGRPLPRFYDLTVERRAEAIQLERTEIYLRRHRMSGRQYFLDVARVSNMDASVALLDVVNDKRSRAMYQQLLMGETYGLRSN